MKKILVPCDFSNTTEKAIKFAIDLAAKPEDELMLLNIISNNTTSKRLAFQDIKFKKVEQRFIELIEGYPKSGITLDYKVLSGKFLQTILKFVETEKIDTIVMGTKGSRGWGEFFMGSNIEKVARTSPVPVFAVRGTHNLKAINDIVFPCNLKLDQPEILLKIINLQKQFHARLHILRINTGKTLNNSKIADKLDEYARHYDLTNFTITVSNEKDIKDGILRFAREINADMIAMVATGKRDLRHMFSESITADVVNHANILVWSCAV